MANYKAITSGNWNNLAIWQDDSSGSFIASTTLPSVSDTVYSNNFTIEVNQDISVLELSAIPFAGLGITSGGFFNVTTNRTITCSFRINGSGTSAIPTVLIQGNSLSVIINANLNCFPFNSTRTLAIQGNLNNLILNGNIVGASGAANVSALLISSTNSLITINGNISGGVTNTSVVFVQSVSGNVINIYGNLSQGGATNTSAVGTLTTGTNTINIYGNITNSISTQGVVWSQGTNTVNIVGIVECFSINPAVRATTCNFSGQIKVINSNFPIQAFPLFVSPSSYITLSQNAGTSNDFVVLSSIPIPSDVRQSVNYTAGNTGTLIVPSPSNVRVGVATDDTVGTADLTAEDFWNYLVSNGFASGSMGERMKNVSTVASTGAQIASYSV